MAVDLSNALTVDPNYVANCQNYNGTYHSSMYCHTCNTGYILDEDN